MGRDFQKQQEKLSQYIFDDYIFNRDFSNTNNVLKNIQLLVDNNLASRIAGNELISDMGTSRYKVACRFLCKYNKELKKFKRKYIEDNFEEGYMIAGTDKRITELNDYALEDGVYYVDLGDKEHDDYAILKVSQKEDNHYRIGFELYFIGYRHSKFKDKYFKLVEKYEKLSQKSTDNYLMYSDRRAPKTVTFKSFDQMVIRDKDKILKYIDNWVEHIPMYHKYGISPKLSILLYGEPGTGKSTFARALAKYLDIDSCMCISPDYFSSLSVNGGRNSLYTYKPTVFTIDDIDCVCHSRKDNKSKDNNANNNTVLSSLLEFLDNPENFYYKAKDGYYYPISIVVATTNYFDKLDDAVKRYGRFDLKIKMDEFNKKEAEEMCALYDLKLSDVYDKPITKDFKISPSYLQALCLENIDNSFKAIN